MAKAIKKTSTTKRGAKPTKSAEQAKIDADFAEARKRFEANNAAPFVVGKAYLVRTVTMIITGRVVGVRNGLLVMQDAAWIADTGRFSTALKTGELSEVEPADGNVLVGIGSIVDVYEWRHALPREVK